MGGREQPHLEMEKKKSSDISVLSCSVMSDSWTVACQAPMSVGFSRQEFWSGLPCPPPGDLPNPRIKPRSPASQVGSLPSEPPGKPPIYLKCLFNAGNSP